MKTSPTGTGTPRRRLPTPPSPASGRRAVSLAVLAGLTLILGLSPFAPAGAHTDLLQGSPGPAQRVGGTVDFIDLVFVDAVTDATIILEDPSGEIVPGETLVADGQILRYEMPALTETGRYVVRFTMISADGDATESGYFFTYDTAGLEPVRLGEVDLPNNDGTVIGIVASVVLAVCLIGLVMVFLVQLERRRAAARESASS